MPRGSRLRYALLLALLLGTVLATRGGPRICETAPSMPAPAP